VHIIHGECVRVGVDEFVDKVFGAADILDLPQPGTLLKQAKVGCVLTRDDRRAPVLSPLTGRVLAVNEKAVRNPEIVCKDPYYDGWLFQMEPSFLKLETQGLYTDEQTFEWMERENERLFKLLGPSYEKMVATGGEIVSDLAGRFPEIGWDALVATFLRTRV
ncbi:MAG TPA: glycine cleavage system protein H, partial [Desulfobacteraceae bacterium]|nr:glycine cleavage system protein H [Desulfobacteraceae bacterium]